jgi:hypothetical protein
MMEGSRDGDERVSHWIEECKYSKNTYSSIRLIVSFFCEYIGKTSQSKSPGHLDKSDTCSLCQPGPPTLRPALPSTNPLAKKLQLQSTKTTEDAGNSSHCYPYTPCLFISSSYSSKKFNLRLKYHLQGTPRHFWGECSSLALGHYQVSHQ